MRIKPYILLGIVTFSVFLSGVFLIENSFASLDDDYNESKAPFLKDLGLKIELIHTGLDFPTQFTFIDEETILVAQKMNGKVVVLKNFILS